MYFLTNYATKEKINKDEEERTTPSSIFQMEENTKME